MNWIERLRGWLNFDSLDTHLWQNAPTIGHLVQDRVLTNSVILSGENTCNLVLEKAAHLNLEGSHNGNIIGKNDNTIRISGEFKGALVCEKLILTKGAKIEGSTYSNKLVIQDGVIFHGTYTQSTSFFNRLKPSARNDNGYLLSDEVQAFIRDQF